MTIEVGFSILPAFLATDRLFVAAASVTFAFVLGIATGPFRGNARPLFWAVLEGSVGRLGKRLDRPKRGRKDLILRGVVVLALGLLLSAVIGGLARAAAWSIPQIAFAEAFLLSLCLTNGAVLHMMFRLYRAHGSKKSLSGAYHAAACSSSVDMSGMDDFGITRNALGFAARVTAMGLVAPVFWYIVVGLPGAYLYAGLAALSWQLGREGASPFFGRPLRFAEAAVGVVPDWITGSLFALAAAFTPTASIVSAFQGLFTSQGRAPYAQGGVSPSVVAWTLNVSLGGAVIDLDGVKRKREWIGPPGATAQLGAGHLKRGIYLVAVTSLLLAAGLIVAGVYVG